MRRGLAPHRPIGASRTGSRSAGTAGGARGQPSRCGLCLRSLKWRRGVCESSWKRRANGAPLPRSPSSPERAMGCNDSPGWRGRQQLLRIENTPKTEGRRKAFSSAPHSQSAECGTVLKRAVLTDRARPQLPSFLLSRVPGVRVLRGWGIGKFQHLRLFGLWRGTGISAVFLLLATLSAGVSALGVGGGQLWSDNGEGEIGKPGSSRRGDRF